MNITYRSKERERRYHAKDGKQLDFLGDVIFGLSVVDIFMKLYPHVSQENLRVSSFVSNATQADIVISFKIGQGIIPNVSNLETQVLSRLQKRHLATFLEALVGLVYLDGGYVEARKLVARLIKEKIKDYKEEDYRALFEVNSETHSSNEGQMRISEISLHNNVHMKERLQFLGYYILNVHITNILMTRSPEDNSDVLANKRGYIINSIKPSILRNLNTASLSVYYEMLDKPPLISEPRRQLYFLLSIIYLVEGYERARVLVNHIVEQIYKEEYSARDYKDLLKNFAKGQFQTVPKYRIEGTGTGDERVFIVEVWINKTMLGRAYNKSKRRAINAATKAALRELGLLLH